MSDSELLARSWEGRPVEEWRGVWNVPSVAIYERVGSTNDVARRLAEAGAPARTLVIADLQTAGRGRAGRAWHAPAGVALLISIVLRPGATDAAEWAPGTIPLRVGLAVARAVERVADIPVALKWPNDLLIETARTRGKLAGILCEGSLGTAGNGYVVAGIGINVGQSAGEFAPGIAETATSLRLAIGRPVSRAELVAALLEEIARFDDGLGTPFPPEILEELAARDPLLGHEITVDGEQRGVAAGIATDGSLIVREEGGHIAYLHSGTVRLSESGTFAPRKVHP